MIYTVKGFSVVNEEVGIFLEFPNLLYDPTLAIWFLVPLPFLNWACTSGSSWFKNYWSLVWRILSITLLLCEVKSLSCVWLCNPMDCNLPASSLHGILQARVLEWVAISFSRGSSRPRDQIRVSLIPGRHFNLWATREAWNGCKRTVVRTFLSVDLLWDCNENWPFPVLGLCWVFWICWHVEWSKLTASSLRFEIAQLGFHHLHLFVVILPKAHLTTHSRMSYSLYKFSTYKTEWEKIFEVHKWQSNKS